MDDEQGWAGSLQKSVEYGLRNATAVLGGESMSHWLGNLALIYADDLRVLNLHAEEWAHAFFGGVDARGSAERGGQHPTTVGVFALGTGEKPLKTCIVRRRIELLAEHVGRKAAVAVFHTLQGAGEVTGLVVGPHWAMHFTDLWLPQGILNAVEGKGLEYAGPHVMARSYPDDVHDHLAGIVVAHRRLHRALTYRGEGAEARWVREVLDVSWTLSCLLGLVRRRMGRHKPGEQPDPIRRRLNHASLDFMPSSITPPAAPSGKLNWSGEFWTGRALDTYLADTQEHEGASPFGFVTAFDADRPGSGPGTVRWAARSLRIAVQMATLIDRLMLLLHELGDPETAVLQSEIDNMAKAGRIIGRDYVSADLPPVLPIDAAPFADAGPASRRANTGARNAMPLGHAAAQDFSQQILTAALMAMDGGPDANR